MKWLQRLKAASPPETEATKPTEPGFVGFAACPVPPSEKCLALQRDAANEAGEVADRWCWPRSAAMNAAEIQTFTTRLARFTVQGLPLADAETSADGLLTRDREVDDRRICLECAALQGRIESWHCSNAVVAGLSGQADAQLPSNLTYLLQRCPGFTDGTINEIAGE
jgi:hypothetical protein